MRNINGNYTSMPNVGDNVQGDDEISRLFADKYSYLYNVYVVHQKLVLDTETSSDKGNCSSLHNIAVDDITRQYFV